VNRITVPNSRADTCNPVLVANLHTFDTLIRVF